MKRYVLLIIAAIGILCSPMLPEARAESPQAFWGVAGGNGYVTFNSDGQVRYTISNDGGYYYGYCGHHHRHHRCRYVKHHKKEYKKWKKRQKKEYKKWKKHHKKHHKHHHHYDD